MKEEAKKKKSAYDTNYIKNNCVGFTINFNKVHDADIIEQLNKQENKRQYIRQLIRSDIEDKKALEEKNKKIFIKKC